MQPIQIGEQRSSYQSIIYGLNTV